MRNLVLCLLMLLAAALWAGCSSPYEVARREVARVTTATQTMESGLKATTKTALDAVVADERAKRTADLKAAGCATDARPAAPADPALAPCAKVWDDAEVRYRARSRDVAAKAAKVDAAIGAIYQTLLLAVQVIGEAEAGVSTKDGLAAAIAKLAPLFDALKAAYNEWKLFAATFKPLPGWLP